MILRGPLLFGLMLMLAAPALGMLGLSLFAYDGISSATWSGFGNWREMLADPLFRQAFSNSLWLALLAVPLRLLLALILALLLAEGGRGTRTGLLLTLAPLLVPPLVWVTAWVWLLNPHFGPIALGLEAFAPRANLWLLTENGSRASLVGVLALMAGEVTLILLLARRQIPDLWYDLAALEGVGRWGQFRRITFPVIAPLLILLALRDFALTLQTSFLPAKIITKGGPNFSTYMLPQYVFENGFEYLRFGYAAAMSSAMLLPLVLILTGQFLLMKHWRRANNGFRQ